jgi:uncharacterized membrane protein YdfJ with MMPL/SSD domain
LVTRNLVGLGEDPPDPLAHRLGLASLPLEALFQIGFTVAFGLLVDTFVVRTLLVPSIAFLLGERNWWPSERRGRVAAPEERSA